MINQAERTVFENYEGTLKIVGGLRFDLKQNLVISKVSVEETVYRYASNLISCEIDNIVFLK